MRDARCSGVAQAARGEGVHAPLLSAATMERLQRAQSPYTEGEAHVGTEEPQARIPHPASRRIRPMRSASAGLSICDSDLCITVQSLSWVSLGFEQAFR